MKINYNNYLYLITVLFFVLGFFNIVFAWLGFICMTLPFVLLAVNKKKIWCQKYCPRASLFKQLFQGRSLTGKAAPKWLVKGDFKWFMLIYFIFNFFVLIMSTIMVFKGRIEPVENLRFMMAFRIPWKMPQLFDLGISKAWVIHMGYRMYSMMLTTTVIGLILGWIFVPRTWCTICPVNTISDMALKRMRR